MLKRKLTRSLLVCLGSYLAAAAAAGCGGNKTDGPAAAGGSSNGGGSSGGVAQGGNSAGHTGDALGGKPPANAGGATNAGATSGGGTSGSGGGVTSGGALGSAGSAGIAGSGVIGPNAPAVSLFIVIDQFGYLPDSEKVAVIRDPQTGFDADKSFTPGASYALVEASSGNRVFTAAPKAWNGGKEDSSSGDKAWWFDFSSVKTAGSYYVLDIDNNVRSNAFDIGERVYAGVLKQAVRMLFYQRAGQAKDAAHAGAGWVDKASFLGPLQDHEARLYSDKGNAATAKDVWGGWYDAGDLNKYTSWTAGYVESLLRSYVENPAAFSDDYDIPESGNGVPDVLDEAKWGMDYLIRLQNTDGSVLSIVGEPSASPPSAATGQSLYGSPSTSATLATAAAFAYGVQVFGARDELKSYAADLKKRAADAYAWAVANPAVIFRNNEAASNTQGLGSGQQEVDDYGRVALKLDAAIQLFRATAESSYRDFVDANYKQAHLIASNYVSPWDMAAQDALVEYAQASGATESVAAAIRAAYVKGVNAAPNLSTLLGEPDPYLAYMKDYTWGSNSTKSNMGNLYYTPIVQQLDAAMNPDLRRAAERFIHYIHGVNPLALVYLSNMNAHGAENSVNEFFHTWFADKSAAWDRVGVSTYGPPPGYLVGGPNLSYDWDGCCPSGCGSSETNAACGAAAPSPPKGQPAQKSYKDFNDSWPLDSWSVTEPSDGYQVAYIRLLSKFVR